jgi:hypothetical protein
VTKSRFAHSSENMDVERLMNSFNNKEDIANYVGLNVRKLNNSVGIGERMEERKHIEQLRFTQLH